MAFYCFLLLKTLYYYINGYFSDNSTEDEIKFGRQNDKNGALHNIIYMYHLAHLFLFTAAIPSNFEQQQSVTLLRPFTRERE